MRFYSALSRIHGLNYPAKILLVTFVGIHVPLLAVVTMVLVFSIADWTTILALLGVLLAATLIGTACTLFVLYDLLSPILAASRALRDYRQTRRLPDLPLTYPDEAGILMRDTDATIRELDTLIQELANFDADSGLPNRSRLLALVGQEIDQRGPFAIVCARIENFREIESFFDLDVSASVISELADRLNASPLVRSVGRVATDVFKFSMAPTDHDDVEQRVTALSRILAAPIVSGRHLFYPRINYGVALYPQDGSDAESLLGAAMTAAVVGSTDKSRKVSFYSAESEVSARQFFLMDQEIREALERREFELHYQPIVDFGRKKVISTEALVRWQHPERGMISPADFIPAAEASGLIVPLGAWIIETACRQAAQWSGALVDVPRISVNISARQFRDPTLLDVIDRSVEAAGIGYDRLKLEITESVLFTDIQQAKRTIGAVQDRGIMVALDDFGADYSNLRYLANFDFDEIKLDRLYVHYVDRDDRLRAICTAIIALSQGLRTPLVAEGVERPEEIDLLHRLGCQMFQGYYFSRPVAAATIPDVVRTVVTDLADLGSTSAPRRNG